MKRYFMEYDSDRKVCGNYSHIWGFASTIKTAKNYISRCRKQDTEYNPRNFEFMTHGQIRHLECMYLAFTASRENAALLTGRAVAF